MAYPKLAEIEETLRRQAVRERYGHKATRAWTLVPAVATVLVPFSVTTIAVLLMTRWEFAVGIFAVVHGIAYFALKKWHGIRGVAYRAEPMRLAAIPGFLIGCALGVALGLGLDAGLSKFIGISVAATILVLTLIGCAVALALSGRDLSQRTEFILLPVAKQLGQHLGGAKQAKALRTKYTYTAPLPLFTRTHRREHQGDKEVYYEHTYAKFFVAAGRGAELGVSFETIGRHQTQGDQAGAPHFVKDRVTIAYVYPRSVFVLEGRVGSRSEHGFRTGCQLDRKSIKLTVVYETPWRSPDATAQVVPDMDKLLRKLALRVRPKPKSS